MPVLELSTYSPFDKQQEFHRSPAKYRLFGGAAGPGKSRALLEEACLQAWETPQVDTLLLRRTFPELQESIIEPFLRYILPQWKEAGASYNASDHIARWPNGSTTRFGHAQNENDIYNYQGGEWVFIGFDELTMFTLKMWQFMTSRNRCRVAGTFPNMAGATNPGNIGHAWVKSLWIDKNAAENMERPENYDKSDYDFIRATLEDNPIYAEDANYIKSLEALPDQMYKMFRLNDWDIFAGQYYTVWGDGTKHVLQEPDVQLKPWWPRWVSIDWGFQHPSAVYWHAKDGDRVITYRELYGSGIGEADLGRQIAELSNRDKLSTGEAIKIEYVFTSPDAFAKRGDQRTVAQQIGAELEAGKLPPPIHADDDRIGGWRLMYQLLKTGLWKISSACPNLIKCLPSLIHDEKRVEDVLKVDIGPGTIGDDPADAARYGLKSMLDSKDKPYEYKLIEALDAQPDYTQKHLTHLRMEDEEAKRKKQIQFLLGRGRHRRFN